MSFDGIMDLNLASIVTLIVLVGCGVVVWYANRPSVLQRFRQPEGGVEASTPQAGKLRPGKFAPRNAAYVDPAVTRQSQEPSVPDRNATVRR
jgi:hypothetical protein